MRAWRSLSLPWKLVLSAAALLVFGELAARAYLLARGVPASRYISVNAALREAGSRGMEGLDTEYPYLPFRPEPGSDDRHSVNSLGFIGPETGWVPEEGVYRVLCMGGSMVYDGIFPIFLDQRLDSILGSGDHGFMSSEVLNLSGPTWTSAENLVAYCTRGCHAEPHALVLYVAVNDVYAMFRPDSIAAEPDYSHYRERWFSVPGMLWDIVPGGADSIRLFALTRYALDRLFRGRYQKDPPGGRLGMRYDFDRDQVLDTVFASYESNLETIAAIAVSRGTRVFLVSEIHDPARSGSPEMASAIEMLNGTAARVAERHGESGPVHFIDAASLIPVSEFVLEDKSHLTAEGNRLLGELIADSIVSKVSGGTEAPSGSVSDE